MVGGGDDTNPNVAGASVCSYTLHHPDEYGHSSPSPFTEPHPLQYLLPTSSSSSSPLPPSHASRLFRLCTRCANRHLSPPRTEHTADTWREPTPVATTKTGTRTHTRPYAPREHSLKAQLREARVKILELTASVDSKCVAVKDYNVCQKVCAERLNKIKRDNDACQKTLAAGEGRCVDCGVMAGS